MQSNVTQIELKREQEQIMESSGAAPYASTGNGVKETIASTEEGGDETKKLPTDPEVAIMPPPPPVLVPLETAEPAVISGDTRPPSSLAASEKDDDEGLSLQVLSARSSTPYTVQGVCCANANCDLEGTDSSTVSPVKEEQTQLMAEEKEIVFDDQNDGADKHNHLNGHLDQRKKYSRSDLLDIRDEMTIVKPECLESARLQRLQFRKFEHGATNGNGTNRNKSYRSSNPPNDLMPAFFKRKAAVGNANGNHSNSSSNSFMYDNFKYTDSNPFNYHGDSSSSSNNNNYRRIGSGRISNRDANWDYIPEEDPNKNNLPDFFNTKDTRSIPPKAQRHQKKYELDDNSNYIKRGINSASGESSFRLGGSRHSINSSGEERYNSNTSSSTNNNNKSDEPEWFSCGPTSRLDIIELCGFNESDQQKIRQEMSKNKTDSNNNREDLLAGHKDKKHLGFQFDDFSTSHNNNNNKANNSGAGSKVPSSKFMPLFNAKKRDEEPSTTHNSTQSLNDFFKRNEMPPAAAMEKLSLTEIPSVDEIEAKWRNPQHHNDSRHKTSSESFNNSSENFKKMLHQLNQQQLGAGSISSPPPQHQQQPTTNQQPPLNLFNTDNLSNFIKHRNLQQQLMQKQQQQAAFAQLQLNAILSRPDTQMLLLSLARGEISKHGLVVQLANPNLSQADQEAISAVLTFSAAGQYHQQLAINSNQQQQQQFIANQLQNLALMQQINKSPVAKRNGNAGGGGGGSGYQANGGASGGSSPRTYTQEELQSHANYILHNAMLKKKLEEQNMGLQKMLHLQMNNSRGANDSLAGTKNFHHQQQQQQQQQQQINQNHHQNQQQQRHRRSSNGNRGNPPMGRRRSTSSSSSNATINSRNVATHIPLNADLQFRRQFEHRRNTIATATVGGGDDFIKIPQRI